MGYDMVEIVKHQVKRQTIYSQKVNVWYIYTYIYFKKIYSVL